MGGLRKQLGLGFFLIPLLQALPLCAEPSDDTLRLFATCTGRLSALMEHQWLMQDPGSDTTQSERDQMIALMEAASPPDTQVQAMNWRLQAKTAQAALLAKAGFAPDPAQAAWAQARAGKLVADCLSLLLAQARA
jgi:hypothetical protein